MRNLTAICMTPLGVGDIRFARAEVLRQGAAVTIRASQRGWIIFADPKQDKTVVGFNLPPVVKVQPGQARWSDYNSAWHTWLVG